MTESLSESRQKRFIKWWSRNSHRQTAHYWLTKTSQRVLHEYAVPPNMWDECKRIIKRYNLSEHKRISQTDAYTLWRLVHPLMTERIQRLTATAAHYAAIRQEKR